MENRMHSHGSLLICSKNVLQKIVRRLACGASVRDACTVQGSHALQCNLWN